MEVKDYCRSVETELYGLKAKMYDMVRKVDKLRRSNKEKIVSQVEQLHKFVSEMEQILEQLQSECPVEFGSQKGQIDAANAGMKEKYEDAMSAVLHF